MGKLILLDESSINSVAAGTDNIFCSCASLALPTRIISGMPLSGTGILACKSWCCDFVSEFGSRGYDTFYWFDSETYKCANTTTRR